MIPCLAQGKIVILYIVSRQVMSPTPELQPRPTVIDQEMLTTCVHASRATESLLDQIGRRQTRENLVTNTSDLDCPPATTSKGLDMVGACRRQSGEFVSYNFGDFFGGQFCMLIRDINIPISCT